jgi:3D (Asp-Asp-Asp) domain-containing protein
MKYTKLTPNFSVNSEGSQRLHHTDLQKYIRIFILITFLINPAWGCTQEENTLKVTATAYNSLPGQTHGDPTLTAWGEKLVPGMKSIAVSRDLLSMGLTRGAKVKIEGLNGSYIVMDKLNKRWKRRIDIYMGTDEKAARQWGKREVTIRW